MRNHVFALASALVLLTLAAGRVGATDFTQFDVVRVRVASLSPAPCPGAASPDCLRVGVVVLIRQNSGTVAGISTQFITGGSFAADVRRDFGLFAPLVFRVTADALRTAAAQDPDPQTKRNAQQFLPTVDAERSYTLAPGVTLEAGVEMLVGKIADDFRRRTGKSLLVVAGAADVADFDGQGLSADDQRALGDAVLSVGGASLVTAGATLRVQFKPSKLKLWVNAFIPGRIQGLTSPLVQGPHLGDTALEGPKPGANECFLTDQRLFSDDPTSSFRMQALVEIDMAASTMKLTAATGKTVRVSCDRGAMQCERKAGSDRIRARNFSSETLADGNRRYFVTLEAAAGNPCVDLAGLSIPSPDIDWVIRVSILFERATGKARISFDGMIEPFPAFEMYALLNGPRPMILFQEGPLPGSSPWNLPGSPNRAVTAVTIEVP